MAVDKFERFDVCLISLDPTQGSEIKKTRPCVVVSPDEMNLSKLATLIVAPMTTSIRAGFKTRVTTKFKQRTAQIALDQIRTIDKKRVIKKLGVINPKAQQQSLQVLQAMFAL